MESSQLQETRRLESWKKPPIDAYVLSRFREMLGIGDLDELPENLYLTYGLHMAVNRWFGHGEVSHERMCELILEADRFPVIHGEQKTKSGRVVRVKRLNCDGIYICRGPFGRDLVNIYGDWKLFDPKDLELPEVGSRDSTVTARQPRVGNDCR